MKKVVVLLLAVSVITVVMLGCESGPAEKEKDTGRIINLEEIIPLGELWLPIVKAVEETSQALAGELEKGGQGVITKIISDVNRVMKEDPSMTITYIPSDNKKVEELAYATGILTGSVKFTRYAIGKMAIFIKNAGRAAANKEATDEAVKEAMADDDIELTEEEIALAKEKAAEFSDEERAELEQNFLYLILGSMTLVQAPIKGAEIVETAKDILENPKQLQSDPITMIKYVDNLKSIIDNTGKTLAEVPKVVKNAASLIAVIGGIIDAATASDEG